MKNFIMVAIHFNISGNITDEDSGAGGRGDEIEIKLLKLK